MCLESPDYVKSSMNMSRNYHSLKIKFLEPKLSRIKQLRPFLLQ